MADEDDFVDSAAHRNLALLTCNCLGNGRHARMWIAAFGCCALSTVQSSLLLLAMALTISSSPFPRSIRTTYCIDSFGRMRVITVCFPRARRLRYLCLLCLLCVYVEI